MTNRHASRNYNFEGTSQTFNVQIPLLFMYHSMKEKRYTKPQ